MAGKFCLKSYFCTKKGKIFEKLSTKLILGQLFWWRIVSVKLFFEKISFVDNKNDFSSKLTENEFQLSVRFGTHILCKSRLFRNFRKMIIIFWRKLIIKLKFCWKQIVNLYPFETILQKNKFSKYRF